MVKTKIIATLGPSSNTRTALRKMFISGLDVARLNFSHGSHTSHLGKIQLVRTLNKKMRRAIKIMQDLEGYRIRIGYFKDAKEKVLAKRRIVFLTKEPDTGDARLIPMDYQHGLHRIKSGQLIYIDDGNIILKVKKSSKKSIKAEVIEGCILKERKGINIPGFRIPFSGLTPKDRQDVEFGIKHKMDYIAQSFVRTRKDVDSVRDLVKSWLPGCLIIAKIENREAIKNIDEIIDTSDGIMIARGDMGIAVPIYEIPIIQKLIIKKCNHKRKFVITATQMLERMTEHSRPTRAEVTDVANSILDGTDFVMLSAETASGRYPIKSVRMMNQIIKFTEDYLQKVPKIRSIH
ncbi:pyruvate kinase [Candidatus Omnitrophota bacterium]